MRPGFRLLVITLMALLVGATELYAQQRPQRPYHGLFGGGEVSTARTQSLDLNVSFGGGYDTNVLATEAIAADANVDAGDSSFALANGTLAYNLRRERLQLAATGMGSSTYYPSFENPWIQRGGASVSAAWQLTGRTSVAFTESFSYDPFYSLLPVPPGGPPLDDPLLDTAHALQFDPRRNFGSTLRLSHSLTQRVSLYAEGSYYSSHSKNEAFDLVSRQFATGVSWTLTRDLSLRLGYRRSTGDFGSEENGTDSTATSHALDGGVDYNHAFSLSRRTTLGFRTGFAGVNDGESTTYSLVGQVALTHGIGRSWSTSLTAGRDVQFVQLLRRAVFADTITASLGGALSRRVQVSASSSFSRGTPGPVAGQDAYRNAFTGASASWAISRNVSSSVNYTFYWYDFTLALPGLGLPGENHRQSISGQIHLWAPLFQRPRRPNATR